MRIALTIPWFLPNRGGAEYGALELSRHLVRRGHEVHVLTPRFRLAWPSYETRDGVRVHRFPSFGLPGLRRASELAHTLWSNAFVPGLLARIKPDLIHMHYILFTGHAASRAAVRLGVRSVLTLVGSDVYDPYYVPGEFFGRWNRAVIKGADRIVAASRFVRDMVCRKFGVRPEDVSLIPYGVDASRFSLGGDDLRMRGRLGISRATPVILSVQRLHERKETQYLLRAAQIVLSHRPEALFLVAGKGPEAGPLKDLAGRLGIDNGLRFLGAVPDEDLADLYRAADVFALHTGYEGFGIVVLEAMASGKPVVTTKAGGTEDIVRDGETGLLAPPRDPEALARAILALLSDPGRASSMGIEARKDVERRFSWETVCEAYLKIYSELAAVPGARPARA
jgi:glycosyltransferase involved in cell wall biosynthesis